MGKIVLDLEPDYDFGLTGISCHARDYRLCWAINRQLSMNFRREPDFDISSNRGRQASAFSQFVYEDAEQMRSYTLFSNRSEGGYLIPEKKQADYLLVLKGSFDDDSLAALRTGLNNIDLILAVFPIDVHSLRSRQNLVF